MQHKYTLYCFPGKLFRSGKHFLVLDKWIIDSSILVLAHGIMSEVEYHETLARNSVPIYQGVSFAWIGIYPAHESKKYNDSQFSGYLSRESMKEWGGYINVG